MIRRILHRPVVLDGSASAARRLESESRRNPLLNESMVLLDVVVQIRRRSATTAATEVTTLLQIGDRAGIGWTPVNVDHSRPWPPLDNASRKDNLAAIRSRFADNMNSIVSPAESTARYR